MAGIDLAHHPAWKVGVMNDQLPLHLGTHRREVNTLSPAQRTRLHQLIDAFIASPADPVTEHASVPPPSIHDERFIAWHLYFVGKLEDWLVINGGAEFVPLPYWYPALPIPTELNEGNDSPALPLPAHLRPGQVGGIAGYTAFNAAIIGYHSEVHMASGGKLPDALVSPGDPIFWPFHAFLVAVYEHWRSH